MRVPDTQIKEFLQPQVPQAAPTKSTICTRLNETVIVLVINH